MSLLNILLILTFWNCGEEEIKKLGGGIGAPPEPIRNAFFYIADSSISIFGFVAIRNIGESNNFFAVGNWTTSEADSVNKLKGIEVFPANIDTVIGGDLGILKTVLVGKNIPDDWLLAINTYRDLGRFVVQYSQFLQSIEHESGTNQKLFSIVNMESQWRNMPKTIHRGLSRAADNFKTNKSTFGGNNRLEDILINSVSQLTSVSIPFGHGINL